MIPGKILKKVAATVVSGKGFRKEERQSFQYRNFVI